MKVIFIMSELPLVREMFCVLLLTSFLIHPSLFYTFLCQSPHITSSSSSSEGDEEEADGEVGGEPPGKQEENSTGKTNSLSSSYIHQQVLTTLPLLQFFR